MAQPPSDTPDEAPPSPAPDQPARPRIRDLEEMDQIRKREEKRYEQRARIMQRSMWVLILAAVAVVAAGWWDLKPRLAKAEGTVRTLRSLVSLQVDMCRRHTDDDPAAARAFKDLMDAEHKMSSTDLPTRIAAFREYRRQARLVCSRATKLARGKRYALFTELATHIGETETELKQAMRQFNQHSKDYNLAVQRFPGSIAQPLVRFPGKLPYLQE